MNKGVHVTHWPKQPAGTLHFPFFRVTPALWIKWHQWHLKVEDLDERDAACARESCHLVQNTDELWASECENQSALNHRADIISHATWMTLMPAGEGRPEQELCHRRTLGRFWSHAQSVCPTGSDAKMKLILVDVQRVGEGKKCEDWWWWEIIYQNPSTGVYM